MNALLIKLGIAAFLQSIKEPKKKADARQTARMLVQGILLAYQDDPEFLEDVQDGN